MTVPIERTATAQLATARIILAQFDEQLREWDQMPLRKRKSTKRGRDLSARLDGLRQGQATWRARVDRLEAEVAEEG